MHHWPDRKRAFAERTQLDRGYRIVTAAL